MRDESQHAGLRAEAVPGYRSERKGREEREFMVIGHRGSPCEEPENTISSFERAVTRDGANALELDLCMTADGEIIIWHDWNPEDSVCQLRRAGLEPGVKYCPCFPDEERPVHTWKFQDFIAGHGYKTKEDSTLISDITIPTFGQFMAWTMRYDEIKTIFLDIKIPEAEIALVPRMLSAIGSVLETYPANARIVFETAFPAVIKAMKQCRPDDDYALDVEPAAGIVIRPSRYSGVRRALRHGNSVATLMRPHATTIAPWSTHRRIIEHDVDLRGRHRRITGEHIDLVSFTVNDPGEMRSLIALGVDGIQTNYPDRLRMVAEEMGVVEER